MNEQPPRYRFGLYVLSGLVLTGATLNFLGFSPIVIRVKEGKVTPPPVVEAPVSPGGIKISLVDSIEMDEKTGRLLITMRLGEDAVKRRPSPAKLASEETDNGTVQAQLVSSVKPILDSVVAAAPPAPTAQDSLQRIQQTLEKVEKLIPQFEKTMEEYRQLAKDSRDAIPEVRQTNDAIRKFIKDVNEIVPDAKRLTKATADAVPDAQALIKSVNAAVPDARALMKSITEAVPDFRELAKEVRETVPDVQKLIKSVNDAIPDARALMKSVNEAVPIAKETMREITIATRNWSQVGERINVFLKSNEDRLNNIVRETETAMTYINEALNKENRNNLATILRNVSEGTKKLPSIADETELFLRQGRGAFKRIDETFTALNRATNLGSTETESMIQNLAAGLDRFNRAMGGLNDLMKVVGQSDGTLRRFITDPGLYNHADDAAILVSRILPRLERIMKDFEVFADKLARHPESLGLGGLVRPSSGIKDPPRSTLYPMKQP